MTSWQSLRRPDWLKELQFGLILGLVVVVGWGVFGAVATAGFGDSLPLQLPASKVTGAVDYGLREGSVIAAEQEVTVTVTDPTPQQRLVWALTTLPTYGMIAALLALLLRSVWCARRGDAFTLAAVRRLRVLAVVALVGGYFGFLTQLIASLYLSSTVTTAGVMGYSQLPAHWFLIGLGLFSVAEVVKRGHAMRTELETVV
ncbi:MAG: hypothetical protein ACRDT8_02805 [Micromonosporaceae bacterium]